MGVMFMKNLFKMLLVLLLFAGFSFAQEGLPTLIGVGDVEGYVPTDAVLYDQTSGSGTNSLASQNFGTANDPFDCQAADDFVVPAGETWNIESVDAPGAYFNGVGPAVDFNVFFYSDAAGLPGTEVASVLNASYTDPGGLGSVSITFPSAVVLTEGTYWVSVQCNMEFAVGGQWGWLEHNPVGSESGWQNPGGGFGSPCTTWGYRVTDCAVGSAPFVDMAFALNGTIGGGQTARVQVIHNSADVLAGEVDVYIDGALALDNFAFRAATPYIDLPAGVTINIGIAPGNSGSANDTLKNFPVVLDPMETYVVFANGVLDPSQYAANPDGRSTAFTLFVKPMARETGLGSDVDFFVLHGSSDAPTVDVKVGAVTLVDDAAYSDITDYIQVPPADYILDLYLSDGVTLVESFIAPLSGLGGGAAAVFASGFLDPSVNQNGAAFGIFAALADGSVVEFVPVGSGGNFPEVIYYQFNETGATQTPNLAVPGSGAAFGTLVGDVTMGGTGQFGAALVGSGSNGTLNNVNTGWVPDLGTSDWTISMYLNNMPAGTALNYLFGENTTGPSFRCFYSGAAGEYGVLLRTSTLGGTDVTVPGVGPGPSVLTFVYDQTGPNVLSYINGVLVLTTPQAAPLNMTGGTDFFTVGGYQGSTSGGLPVGAFLDEFRFYNRALDAAEVAATWNIQIPVELTSFTASVGGNNVTLNWETATEINNSGFAIERKFGTSDFVQVGFVAGHGTTTEPQAYSFTENSLMPGIYSYRLKQLDFDGTFDYSNVVEVEVLTPGSYTLAQNYPNPFNPSTKITFSLADDSKVTLKIFDLLGQEVSTLVNQDLTAGVYNYDFNATGINSGVYFYKIEAVGVNGNEFIDIKKMMLLK